MKLTIFYSWQMTTSTDYNKFFIRDCIKESIKKVQASQELKKVEIEFLEGISGSPGSPQVASEIMDTRIPNCDIFIADLSVINYIPKYKQYIRKFLKDAFKPSVNNNVILEYGIAYRELGEYKMIGVINKAYGTPNENSSNIPFDIRHIRFPIEYRYSKQSEKKNAKVQLVENLTAAIRTTALYALQHQKDRYRPLVTWEDWCTIESESHTFHNNEHVSNIMKSVRLCIQNPKESLRLVGLSGLGKTRIMLETFRCGSDVNSIILSSRVLYINYNDYQNIDFSSLLSKVIDDNQDHILVIDNCPQSVHRLCLRLINSNSTRISLITIDSCPEEVDYDKIKGVIYLSIKTEDMLSVVNDILNKDFSLLGKDSIEKIKEFSQGIPLMAVLIGQSIQDGEQYIGKMDDKDLLDKLLGQTGQNPNIRTILRSCSLFSYFGLDDDLRSQAEFIATNKNITSITGDNQVLINQFNETCTYYLKREILEKKGRYIGMRPLPLAMSLTQEWLETCTPIRLLQIITDISNLKEPDRDNLSNALAERMKYLGYSEKAKSIIDIIIGIDSPFDNAEVLNTELGSRLFRSFVEVNPVAVSKNFTRLFSNMNTDNLLRIIGGRRNIVWVLEKLCFDRRTFIESAKVMCSFAIAENESWANNATGQFLHLFQIYLPGTEANLEERWEIMEWGLNNSDHRFADLTVRALRVGLNSIHFSRSGGPETQGSKSLTDYHPSYPEIDLYWKRILTKLEDIVKMQNDQSEAALNVVAESIRSMFFGRAFHILIPTIKAISEFKNNDWDNGLKELKIARKYEKGNMTIDQLAAIDKLIDGLTKKDFATRYSTLVDTMMSEIDGPYSSERTAEATKELADEFVNEGLNWEMNFNLFYTFRHGYAHVFGQRIYELLVDKSGFINKFISQSIETLQAIPKEVRISDMLGGFFYAAKIEIKDQIIDCLMINNELNYFVFYLASLDDNGKRYFSSLFSLIENHSCSVEEFSVFAYSNVLTRLRIEELIEFAQRLFTFGEVGYAITFNLYFTLGYFNKEKKIHLNPIMKDCILKLGLFNTVNKHLDRYHWTETISSILADITEYDFAIHINQAIIESITLQNSYHLDSGVQGIYSIMMQNHFDAVWPKLSESLLLSGKDIVKFYGLKNILGSSIGGISRNVGVLFGGNINSIFDWSHANKPLAPTRIASLVPIFDVKEIVVNTEPNEDISKQHRLVSVFNEANTNYTKWHPIAMRLIDEFGDIKDVLESLDINMGNYSWTGSIIPLLENKKTLFKAIVDHRITKVREWAQCNLRYLDIAIEHEKIRDAEMYIM